MKKNLIILWYSFDAAYANRNYENGILAVFQNTSLNRHIIMQTFRRALSFDRFVNTSVLKGKKKIRVSHLSCKLKTDMKTPTKLT